MNDTDEQSPIEQPVGVAVTLNRLDRCDSCPAAAQSIAARPDVAAGLLFCGHHLNRHREALEAQGFIVLESALGAAP